MFGSLKLLYPPSTRAAIIARSNTINNFLFFFKTLVGLYFASYKDYPGCRGGFLRASARIPVNIHVLRSVFFFLPFRFIFRTRVFLSFAALKYSIRSKCDKLGSCRLSSRDCLICEVTRRNKRRKCFLGFLSCSFLSFSLFVFFFARRGKLHIGKPSNPFATVLLLAESVCSNPLASARILTRELSRRIERPAALTPESPFTHIDR